MKTRIDILSGYHRSGKTDLAMRMLATGSYQAEKAVACCGSRNRTGLIHELQRILSQGRPGRLLLELPANMLLEDMPSVIREFELQGKAFVGSKVFVLDGGSSLRGEVPQEYCDRQARQASIVFVNRVEPLDAAAKLCLLNRIWSVNPRVSLMVEPLYGIDLWRVFDL